MKTHGQSETYLYNAWGLARRRCQKPTDPAWENYGGRGITFHPAWNDFVAFKAYVDSELGPRPSLKHTLDRENNNAGYVPGNIRWATRVVQNRNRRDRKVYAIDGVAKSLPEWSEESQVDARLIWQRVQSGWDLKRAVFLPGVKGRNQFSASS